MGGIEIKNFDSPDENATVRGHYAKRAEARVR
jgi:hypothetical protein